METVWWKLFDKATAYGRYNRLIGGPWHYHDELTGTRNAMFLAGIYDQTVALCGFAVWPDTFVSRIFARV